MRNMLRRLRCYGYVEITDGVRCYGYIEITDVDIGGKKLSKQVSGVGYTVLRLPQNLFIQDFLFIHPGFVLLYNQ